MTILPFLILVGSIVLAVLFEMGVAFLYPDGKDRFSKVEWIIAYWIIIGVTLLSCRVLSIETPGKLLTWLPFFIVAGLHCCSDFEFDWPSRNTQTTPPPSAQQPQTSGSRTSGGGRGNAFPCDTFRHDEDGEDCL